MALLKKLWVVLKGLIRGASPTIALDPFLSMLREMGIEAEVLEESGTSESWTERTSRGRIKLIGQVIDEVSFGTYSVDPFEHRLRIHYYLYISTTQLQDMENVRAKVKRPLGFKGLPSDEEVMAMIRDNVALMMKELSQKWLDSHPDILNVKGVESKVGWQEVAELRWEDGEIARLLNMDTDLKNQLVMTGLANVKIERHTDKGMVEIINKPIDTLYDEWVSFHTCSQIAKYIRKVVG